ncbi:MAG: hypothetical protein CMH83_21800 [Nocardioides sp.]|nr:hypothetical protein [Nocardioides sp.]
MSTSNSSGAAMTGAVKTAVTVGVGDVLGAGVAFGAVNAVAPQNTSAPTDQNAIVSYDAR